MVAECASVLYVYIYALSCRHHGVDMVEEVCYCVWSLARKKDRVQGVATAG